MLSPWDGYPRKMITIILKISSNWKLWCLINLTYFSTWFFKFENQTKLPELKGFPDSQNKGRKGVCVCQGSVAFCSSDFKWESRW